MKPLQRIYVDAETKKKLKVGAAQEGISLADFVRKKINTQDILEDQKKAQEKRGGKSFKFPI